MRTPVSWSIAALLLAAPVVGCAGSVDPIDGSGAELTAAHPLPEMDADEWSAAEPGCEGRIDGSERYATTSHDALVVAMRDGTTLCVDTFRAIQVQLDVLGESAAARVLQNRYYASFDLETLEASNPGEGDPNPQPSIEDVEYHDPFEVMESDSTAGPGEGDPNPQPSMDPSEGDPNPQPSHPGSGGGETMGGDSGTDDGPGSSTAAAGGSGSSSGT